MDQSFLLLQRLLRASARLGLQRRGEEGNTAGNRQQNGADGWSGGSYTRGELVEIVNSRRGR